MEWVWRSVLGLLGGLGAVQLGASLPLEDWIDSPWRYVAWAAIVLVGALIGVVIGSLLARVFHGRLRAIDRLTDRYTAAQLTVGAIGLVVGLIAAALAGVAVAQLPIIGPYLLLPVVLVVAYIFSRIAARRHLDILRLIGIRSRSSSEPQEDVRILDTSAIIDGRVIDVVKTGFIGGSLVVPGFVLAELQRIADSGDGAKRARGRRGLDLVEELRSTSNGDFTVKDWKGDPDDDVDASLVRMAKDMGAAIVTTDFNLNKVARIQEIEVLNVNELANALKPAVLPGEPLNVKIIREGKEFDQGVGYLDDGTMIIVEGGRRALGEQVAVEVTSVLQSPSGKMIFTRMIEVGEPSQPGSS